MTEPQTDDATPVLDSDCNSTGPDNAGIPQTSDMELLKSTGNDETPVLAGDTVHSPLSVDHHESEQCVPLPFKLFVSKVARSITNEDMEQIKFILTDELGGEMASTLSTGYDTLNTLIRTNTIDERNVLFLQLLCAAIGNQRLIDDVYKWAENMGDVLHFHPPVTCDYSWKFSGPLHVRGAKFEQYSERDIEDIVQRAMGMLSTAKALGGVSDAVTEDQAARHEADMDHTPRFHLSEYELSCELNIYPEFDGLHRAENTIPKSYMTEDLNRITELIKDNQTKDQYIKELTESVEALTDTINRLRETIRLQEDQKNVLDENSEEIEALEEKLKEKDEIITFLEESLSTEMQTVEELKSELKKVEEEERMQDNVKAAENEELMRQIQILQLLKETYLVRIGQLEYDLEMKDISLSNERNNKEGRHDLDYKLQAISEHSLAVRKACGIFDPGSMPIPLPESEYFKHFFTYKITRLYPQMLYSLNSVQTDYL